MDMFDMFYGDRKEVLARFLKVEKNDLQSWHDGSFTLLNRDDFEYHVLNNKDDRYMEYLGESEGYHIYKN